MAHVSIDSERFERLRQIAVMAKRLIDADPDTNDGNRAEDTLIYLVDDLQDGDLDVLSHPPNGSGGSGEDG